jgi:hypothetical protein
MKIRKLGRVAQACNLSTQKAEVRGLQVSGQPRLYSKALSQKKGLEKLSKVPQS